MNSEIQQAVVRVVWPWNVPSAPAADPVARLRRKALIQALVMAAVAALLFFGWHHRTMAGVLSALAALNLALGLAAPRAFGAVDRALQRFGGWAGQAMTWILLVPFYYLVFVPARLILLAAGRDPMKRRFPDKLESYWVAHRKAAGPDDYRKQF